MSACPACGTRRTKVLESYQLAIGWTRRRRRCNWGCGARWASYELTEYEIDLSAHDPADLARASRCENPTED